MEKRKLLLFGFPGEYAAEKEREADLWGEAGDLFAIRVGNGEGSLAQTGCLHEAFSTAQMKRRK
jgi:hypothetical protein